MQQIFIDQSLIGQSEIELSGQPYRHLIKALRFGPKSKFMIVDVKQKVYQATVTSVADKAFQAQIKPKERLNTELPIKVTIACSLSKKDKVDWITQKSTELGATEILFFNSRYSIMKWHKSAIEKKLARLQQIADSAAEQSHRLIQPKVLYLPSLKEVYQQTYDYKLVAYEESAKKNETAQLVQTLNDINENQSLICLFGPEGGFAVEEVEQMVQNNYKACGLGPRILRAETAPVYFLSSVSYQLELK